MRKAIFRAYVMQTRPWLIRLRALSCVGYAREGGYDEQAV
jgi:hypothetical protein